MKDRKIEQYPFEFSLRINGHIFVSRSFNIPNFNPDVLDSLELKELLEIVGDKDFGIIPEFLKDRSCDYLQHFEDNPRLNDKHKENEVKDIWLKDDNYSFEIKVEGKVVGIIQFPGNTYPPRIRYNVKLGYKTNIWGDKELDENGKVIKLTILQDIQREIKKTFSKKSYVMDYRGYPLDAITEQDEKYVELYSTYNN